MDNEIRSEDSLIIPPRLEPLDLEEVKKQRRVTATSLDTLFDLWIPAARQLFEEQTGRQLMTATWETRLDCGPSGCVIELPHPPLQAVLSIVFDDATGIEQTFDASAYTVIAPSGPYARRGRVVLVSGATWPTGPMRIRYRAGYGDAIGDVSELIRYALMMLVGHFHKYGEEVSEARANILQLPIGAKSVMDALKYTALPTISLTRSSASFHTPWNWPW
jgi:uncharacterized phiE125 gp8 family phage protein